MTCNFFRNVFAFLNYWFNDRSGLDSLDRSRGFSSASSSRFLSLCRFLSLYRTFGLFSSTGGFFRDWSFNFYRTFGLFGSRSSPCGRSFLASAGLSAFVSSGLLIFSIS